MIPGRPERVSKIPGVNIRKLNVVENSPQEALEKVMDAAETFGLFYTEIKLTRRAVYVNDSQWEAEVEHEEAF